MAGQDAVGSIIEHASVADEHVASRTAGPDLREFVDTRSQALLRAAFLLTGDVERAEDLLQTALPDRAAPGDDYAAARDQVSRLAEEQRLERAAQDIRLTRRPDAALSPRTGTLDPAPVDDSLLDRAEPAPPHPAVAARLCRYDTDGGLTGQKASDPARRSACARRSSRPAPRARAAPSRPGRPYPSTSSYSPIAPEGGTSSPCCEQAAHSSSARGRGAPPPSASPDNPLGRRPS